MNDTLSVIHFKAVWAEIQGRFFSEVEADELKAIIDRATVTDPKVRAAAAKCWERAAVSASTLEMYVVYQRPRDYPEKFVVRRWAVGDGPEPRATDFFTLHETLEEARESIPSWLIRFNRSDHDDPCIVESYI